MTLSQARREEHFWARVIRGGPDECWIWTGAKLTHTKHRVKYGKLIVSGKYVLAHRYSWKLAHGYLADDVKVRHNCDNPPCVNPHHLLLGTQADNIRDAVARGRMAGGERHGSVTHPERVARGARHGWALHPERCLRGEDHGQAKLTWDDVRNIRTEYGGGALQRDLAQKFGVSQGLVSLIVINKIWKTLQQE